MFTAIFRTLCDRNHCPRIALAIEEITPYLSAELVVIKPCKNKTGYISDRLPKLAILLRPLGIERMYIIVNGEPIEVEIIDLIRQYPALGEMAIGLYDRRHEYSQKT